MLRSTINFRRFARFYQFLSAGWSFDVNTGVQRKYYYYKRTSLGLFLVWTDVCSVKILLQHRHHCCLQPHQKLDDNQKAQEFSKPEQNSKNRQSRNTRFYFVTAKAFTFGGPTHHWPPLPIYSIQYVHAVRGYGYIEDKGSLSELLYAGGGMGTTHLVRSEHFKFGPERLADTSNRI